MTYQDDANLNRRNNRMNRDDTSYTGWIIGGVIALAVVIGIFALMGRDNTNTASNNANRPAATAPATTGSGPATPNTSTAPTPAPAR
jgi:hypothetical protein